MVEETLCPTLGDRVRERADGLEDLRHYDARVRGELREGCPGILPGGEVGGFRDGGVGCVDYHVFGGEHHAAVAEPEEVPVVAVGGYGWERVGGEGGEGESGCGGGGG